ncbi:CAP domain-containing protein [Aquimarina sp. MMG016]|uniref:CAP domain-containing protein n=1 Tax=Aquimarina sp. MMG016 TaxID=2822690 RepID=UPI001B3A6BDF|nr:CAP domain-containing protein [Aquimarina sp. MMG016]MBQ4822273.1 CAP domain-containing protein [Aquimarina sp. MMG016]
MKTTLVKYLRIFTLLLFVISCSDDSSSEIEQPVITNLVNDISVANEIHRLVNQHRQSIGLSPLQKNSTAEGLAVDHTNYMIVQGDISHDNFNARGDILNEKENARNTAENVAYLYRDAQSVVNGWLNSSGHKKNIEGNYTYTGIAAIKDQQGRYYYTQLFYR